MAIVWIIIGSVVGAVLAWLFAERRARAGLTHLHSTVATSVEKAAGLSGQLESVVSENNQLRQQLSQSDMKTASLAANLESAKANLIEQRKLLDDAQGQLRHAFASVSAEALAKNNEAFLQLAKGAIYNIVHTGIGIAG